MEIRTGRWTIVGTPGILTGDFCILANRHPVWVVTGANELGWATIRHIGERETGIADRRDLVVIGRDGKVVPEQVGQWWRCPTCPAERPYHEGNDPSWHKCPDRCQAVEACHAVATRIAIGPRGRRIQHCQNHETPARNLAGEVGRGRFPDQVRISMIRRK